MKVHCYDVSSLCRLYILQNYRHPSNPAIHSTPTKTANIIYIYTTYLYSYISIYINIFIFKEHAIQLRSYARNGNLYGFSAIMFVDEGLCTI